ncbi:unnamed protein product [Protopolystoma xenopodis]|uniref:Uncharacterized protein n=1 Tax=Protopolystoma xenopodis TaxID=117903 RepID=A0A448XQX5_9PLAT|nr:unnamed protein product [Protopolystoma xenopodis]
MEKRVEDRSHHKTTADALCTAAVWLYYDVQADKVHKTSIIVSGEDVGGCLVDGIITNVVIKPNGCSTT